MTDPIEKKTVLDKDIAPDELIDKRFPIHLVLDNIRSAFNVGSAFRTADACCIEKIHICGISAYPPNKKLEKTALGATGTVPWEYYKTSLNAIETLHQQNIPICIVELTNQSTNHWDFSFDKPIALVFGHEVTGVSDEIMTLGDHYLHIPMYGKKTTLNVATAIGVILFEVLRQYRV